MVEIYDKDGNPIPEVYDEEGNPIDETLTPEEVEAKIQEAKEEAKGELESEFEKLQSDLKEKEEGLLKAQEELEKEKEKEKNFGKLNKITKKKEEKVEKLEEQIANLQAEIQGVKKGSEEKSVNAMIDKIVGEDAELKKKIKFYYDSFAVPEDDTEEQKAERVKNAHILATGGQNIKMGSDAIGTGSGQAPEEPKNQGKLSEGARDVAYQLGIDDKELKKNKLI